MHPLNPRKIKAFLAMTLFFIICFQLQKYLSQ